MKFYERWLRRAAAALMAVSLAACGGGGSGGTPLSGGGSDDSGTTTTATLTVSLSSTTVTAATPATVTATVLTAAGAPVAGQVVSFAASGSAGTFSPSSALTDSQGRAVTSLSPASATSSGADTVVATAVLGSTTLTARTGFQLTATNVAIASFTSDLTTLSAYGQTTLTAVLSGTTSGTPVTLNLTSTCATEGKASITPASQATTTGTATFTYRDLGCAGSISSVDQLTLSVAGSALTAARSLSLTSPEVASIRFISASPETIYLAGTGLTENSTVTFRVVDAAGQGLREQNVQLELTTLTGGVKLDDAQVVVTKKTDSNGDVTVRINAGTVPTPVRVKATLAGSSISTVSSNLAVAVGLPSQLNFSLSQQTINIEAGSIDGTSNNYTIIASDRMGNPVPAGTTINFVSTSGQIRQSAQTTINGSGLASATVAFQSAEPRMANGRFVVAAYALGEESFLDLNGDNAYSSGEPFLDLGDIYFDRYANGVFNVSTDQYISLGLSGTSVCATPSSSLLQVSAFAVPSRPSTCDAVWGKNYVRRQALTIASMSSAFPVYGTSLPAGAFVVGASTSVASDVCPSSIRRVIPADGAAYDANEQAVTAAYFPFGTVRIAGLGQRGTIAFVNADANPVALNPMAAGTTISVAGTTGLTVSVVGGSPVPSTSAPTTGVFSYAFADDASVGTATVTLTSPSGLRTSFQQILYRNELSTLTVPAGQQIFSCP
ncbi:Ig-like domain-containing protein [Pseudaquabacterium rugosum]|uniref:Ig-like domain-containing protein n=1 Tax=Pseudaquabacterium rugosum TaxID=2984194 RepID=A0ABU9B491_9BURK